MKKILKKITFYSFFYFILSGIANAQFIIPEQFLIKNSNKCLSSQLSYHVISRTLERINIAIDAKGFYADSDSDFESLSRDPYIPLGIIDAYFESLSGQKSNGVGILQHNQREYSRTALSISIPSEYYYKDIYFKYLGGSAYTTGIQGLKFCGAYFVLKAPAITLTPTSTTLLVQPSGNLDAGAAVLMLAATSSSAGALGADGKVIFYEGTTAISPEVALSGSGSADFSYTLNNLGSRGFSAQFKPNIGTTFAASNSAVVNVNVMATTALKLTANEKFPLIGKPVMLTANLTGGNFAGTISFKEGNTVLQSNVGIDANGAAQITVSNLSAGKHSISAIYSGDAGHKPSTANGLDIEVLDSSFLPIINNFLLN